MTPPLSQVLEQLAEREPLFHRRALVSSEEDFLPETADDFREIGASGTIYSRMDVLAVLKQRWMSGDVDEIDTEHWTTSEHTVTHLAADTFLLNYTLHGQGRITRRTTIWQRDPNNRWRARFHQGTVIA